MKKNKYYTLNADHTYDTCTYKEWGKQFLTLDRHLGDTEIKNVRISTVWIGMDANISADKAYVFETMILDKDNNSLYQNLYSSWDEAIKGHKETCIYAENELLLDSEKENENTASLSTKCGK